MRQFHIQWHITESCNLRCKHCYQEKFEQKEDLSFEEIQKLFNHLIQFLRDKNRKLTVDITGGEPLLHKDFWKILDMLEENNTVSRCGIITNGTLLDKNTIKLLSEVKKLKVIKVSCEGVEKNVYEYFRHFPFEKFLNTLENLSNFHGEKLLIFTLFETNADQVMKLFETIEKFNLDGFIVERFFPMGKGYQLKDLTIHKKTWKTVIKNLFEACDILWDPEIVSQYRGFKVLKKNSEYQLFGAPCIIGKDGCAIMHNGDVYPCRRFPLKIGNAVLEPFEKIWDNNRGRKIKKRDLKGICGICRVKGCLGCRAFSYCVYGDDLAEDPLCILF